MNDAAEASHRQTVRRVARETQAQAEEDRGSRWQTKEDEDGKECGSMSEAASALRHASALHPVHLFVLRPFSIICTLPAAPPLAPERMQ